MAWKTDRQDFSIKAAEAKCERLLACRERSSSELRQRLARDGFPEGLVDALVNRLVAAGLVDDERFCRLYIESKRNQGWGMQRIIYALKGLGVDVAAYPELDQSLFDPADELSRAIEMLGRYRGRAKDGYSGRYRYLATKGFSVGIISQALNCWRQEISA